MLKISKVKSVIFCLLASGLPAFLWVFSGFPFHLLKQFQGVYIVFTFVWYFSFLYYVKILLSNEKKNIIYTVLLIFNFCCLILFINSFSIPYISKWYYKSCGEIQIVSMKVMYNKTQYELYKDGEYYPSDFNDSNIAEHHLENDFLRLRDCLGTL